MLRFALCFSNSCTLFILFINHGIYLQKTGDEDGEDDEYNESEKPNMKAEPKEKAAPKKRASKRGKMLGFFCVLRPFLTSFFMYLGI